MTKEKNLKKKILKELLKSPLTTGEVALALGYQDKINPKYGGYKYVDYVLKKLVDIGLIREIEAIKKTPGNPGTTYDIIYNMENIKEIYEKYSLGSDLQKNDRVIEILNDEHKWIININLYQLIKELSERSKTVNSYRFSHTYDYYFEFIPSFKNDLIEKLKTSVTFFKLFVINSPDALKRRSFQIYYLVANRKFLASVPKNNIIINSFLDVLYEACVFSDMLDGEKCDEAIQYINEMKKLKSKAEDRGTEEQGDKVRGLGLYSAKLFFLGQ